MSNHRVGKPINYFFLAIVFVAGIGASAAIFYGLPIQERNDGNLDNATVPTVEISSSSANSADLSGNVAGETANGTHSPIYSLVDIAKLHSPLERSTALHFALSEAKEDRVLALLDQSKQLDYPARVQAQAVILQKLVRVNPSRALTQIGEFNQPISSDVLSAMFSEWVQLDLNEAISHATTLDSTGKQAALEGILQERIDLTDQKCREIARQLGNEQYAINVITLEKLNKSIAEPEEVWEEIVKEAPHDSKQLELLTQVAQIWVKKQGLEALNHIFASLANHRTRSFISRALYREVAKSNPNGALEHAKTVDNVPYYDSVLIVVEEWTRSDVHSALAAIDSMSGEVLQQAMFNRLVETWATDNPNSLLENLNLLPLDMVNLATQTAISTLATRVPRDASAMLVTVEDESVKLNIAMDVITHWIASDLNAALDWVLNDPDLEFGRTILLSSLLLKLVDQDPERAMRVALERPMIENELGPEYWVITRLGQTDVNKAIELMPEVRDGITKTEAYRGLGSELVKKGMTDKALQLVQEIPQYAKETYLSQMLGTWVNRDPTGLVESFDQMPSAEVASSAALKLLLSDPWGEHLNSEQRELVRVHLTEEDTKRLERLNLKTAETRIRWR